MTAPYVPPPSAHAWTPLNRILASSTAGLQGLDWLSTLGFLGKGGTEGNPLLGAHPSAGKVNTLVPLGMLATQGIGAALPSNLRNVWYGGLSALEVAALIRNLTAGHGVTLTGSIPVP